MEAILNGLHGVISQKMILFITTAVKTSNPTRDVNLHSVQIGSGAYATTNGYQG
jgi:hypothetical protein